jgi:hypothetical protein
MVTVGRRRGERRRGLGRGEGRHLRGGVGGETACPQVLCGGKTEGEEAAAYEDWGPVTPVAC